MINMSYCRFANTEEAMEECLDALYSGDTLSDSEYNAANRLMELCERFLGYKGVLDELYEDFEHEYEDEEYDDDY